MNHVYRTVFNRILGLWQVTSELSTRRGKSSGSAKTAKRWSSACFALLLPLTATAADLPTGGNIVAGSGSIAQNGNSLNITQNSHKLIANWQSFDIAAGHTVNFLQPGASAVALNRVLGNDASQIFGSLNANGQVFLVNPNGVLFGQGAQVDVGGLVASTLGISDSDFLNGHYVFSGQGGTVRNQGSLRAHDGGAIALLGGKVSNEGVIEARLGNVALASGQQLTLDFAGDGLLSVTVDESALNALVENHGLIRADGGSVLLTADAGEALLQTVVNNSGVIEARTLEERDGKIVLLGGFEGGVTQVAGRLDASAPTSGNGGFIETSGANVQIADSAVITTKAENGQSGTWLIDPNDFTIAASGGNMTGAAVSDALNNNGNFIIETATMGTAGGNGNIHVNDTVSWSQNTLTLNAERNININTEMFGSGTAGLALEYGNTYNVHAPVNLASTGSFTTKKGSDAAINWTIITSLGEEGSTTGTDLQGMNGDWTGHYVLGANIDASATKSWNGGLGFDPIAQGAGGDISINFSGALDGLGHVISNLFIDRISASKTDKVGLISTTDGASIRNIGLVDADISGRAAVGGLVGRATDNTDISNSYVTGKVGATFSAVGGLIGTMVFRTSISNSYSSADVSLSSGGSVGGLAGGMGLTGNSINNSYATGNISGEYDVGGLVGYMTRGTVSNSYFTGTVSGTSYVGGLIGRANHNEGFLANLYWNTDTAGSIGIAVDNSTKTNVAGLTAAQMKIGASFAGFDISGNGGENTVWRIYEGDTAPLLRSFLTPLTITPDFNGYGSYGDIAAYTTSGPVDESLLLGTKALEISNTATNGQATVRIGGLYSGQHGYDIKTVTKTLATGASADDLVINDSINWSSGLLRLRADGNIDLRAVLNATNTAGLALDYGNTYIVRAPVNIASTGSFSTKKGTDDVIEWTIITSLGEEGSTTGKDLQGINGNLSGNYVLGADIDASGTAGWEGGRGFDAIAKLGSTDSNSDIYFSGALDGLGHVINKLTINRTNTNDFNMGLFSITDGALIRNIGLVDVDIAGRSATGGFVGRTRGAGETVISNSHITGKVSASGGVGGFVGAALGNLGIYNSHSGADVYATNTSGESDAGGLVGRVYLSATATFDNLYATGNVIGYNDVGGLFGATSRNTSISNSYFSGTVQIDVTGQYARYGALASNAALSTFNNVYWNTDTAGTVAFNSATGSTLNNVVGLTTAQLQNPANLTGFTFSNTVNGGAWTMVDGVMPMLISEWSPYIRNAHQLQLMGLDLSASYVLANNIDASATHGQDVWYGSSFSSVGNATTPFTGSFDGLGHSILDLVIHRPAQDDVGLFGQIGNSGVVRNVGLIGGAVTGRNRVGSLAGMNSGTLENVHATGAVTGVSAVGGLVGTNFSGTISKAHATGAVTGEIGVGGLVGNNASGTISNAYATGAVTGYSATGTSSLVGGLVGDNFDGTIRYTYATGAVSGDADVGGLVGDSDDGSSTIIGSYWATETTGQAVGCGNAATCGGGATGKTTLELIASLPAGFDPAMWGNADDRTTPYLMGLAGNEVFIGSDLPGTIDITHRPNRYTVIQTLDQLQAANNDLDANYVLVDDIDASDTVNWNGGEGFMPIGGYSGPTGTSVLEDFTGIFDGFGHTISGLTINRPSQSYIGLFGSADGSVIRNIGVIGGAITGRGQVGGLAGFNRGTISNAYATATVTARGADAGGLVGFNYEGAISNAYATGAVTGGIGSHAGGLVGENWRGTIDNAYATGAVTGSGRVGGLVGGNQASTIRNSYATGAVSGNEYVGGLVGFNHTSGTVTESYWNTETSGGSAGCSGTTACDGGATGITTAQMQQLSTFTDAGWDISDQGGDGTVWRIYEGQTAPLLRSFLTQLVVSTTPDFDGSGAALANIGSVTLSGLPSGGAHIHGTAVVTNGEALTLTSTQAGEYTAMSNATVSGLYSDQQGYDISYGSSSRVISTPGSVAGELRLSNGARWQNGTLVIDTAGIVTVGGAIDGDGFRLLNGAWLQNNATLPGFAVNDFRIDGGSFLRVLGGNGSTLNPWQIADVYGLQGIGTYLSSSFTLANGIDASGTVAWNGGLGFRPIGDNTNHFTGSLDGLGHTIDGLVIHRPNQDYVGLFGFLRGEVRDLGLVDAEVTGRHRLGSLAGYNGGGTVVSVFAQNVTLTATGDYAGGLVGVTAHGGGGIVDAWATGTVSSSANFVGGLVGYAHSGSHIRDAWANVAVSGVNQVGGLLGYNKGTHVANVQAHGDVSASGNYVGGLVGVLADTGSLVDATATGKVSSSQHYVGGLVGYTYVGSLIRNARATGEVNGQHQVGGLAGYNRGSLLRVQASGEVVATGNYVGGLVGVNAPTATISEAWATGHVSTTHHYVGGLVGYSHIGSTISDARADGSVSGISRVGGLIGQHGGSLVNGLATGQVTASYFNGGLIGHDGGGSVTASFWDVQSSGQLGSAIGGTGLDTVLLQQRLTYTAAGWSVSTDSADETVWLIEDGSDYPRLRHFASPL